MEGSSRSISIFAGDAVDPGRSYDLKLHFWQNYSQQRAGAAAQKLLPRA